MHLFGITVRRRPRQPNSVRPIHGLGVSIRRRMLRHATSPGLECKSRSPRLTAKRPSVSGPPRQEGQADDRLSYGQMRWIQSACRERHAELKWYQPRREVAEAGYRPAVTELE